MVLSVPHIPFPISLIMQGAINTSKIYLLKLFLYIYTFFFFSGGVYKVLFFSSLHNLKKLQNTWMLQLPIKSQKKCPC